MAGLEASLEAGFVEAAREDLLGVVAEYDVNRRKSLPRNYDRDDSYDSAMQ